MKAPYFWLGPAAEPAMDIAVLRERSRGAPIDFIQAFVAIHFGCSQAEMKSARRSRTVVRPRQIAMYLARELTPASLPDIGKRFGDRDHTTVMHAIRKVRELCAEDSAFATEVDALREKLAG